MSGTGDLDLPGGRPDPDWQSTGLRLHQGEPWRVAADIMHPGGHVTGPCRVWRTNAAGQPVATLRRIGWLDQRGRTWQAIPASAKAAELGCGSFTPLLIDPGERT